MLSVSDLERKSLAELLVPGQHYPVPEALKPRMRYQLTCEAWTLGQVRFWEYCQGRFGDG